MIVVLLKNKLISCDTIAPVMLELRKVAPGVRVRFYAPNEETYDAITRNVVLREAVDEAGELRVLPARSGGPLQSRLVEGARKALWYASTYARAVVGRVTFVHFGALDRPPLSRLARAARGRTFRFQDSAWTMTEAGHALTHIVTPAQERRWSPVGDVLVAFQDDWSALRDPVFAGTPQHLFGPSRLRAAWLDWIDERSPKHLASLAPEVGVAEPLLVFILGTFTELDYLRAPTLDLFHETLDVLVAAGGGTPIVLKPHVFTDMAVVERAVADRPDARIVVSYLHPQVLATRAALFVANVWSTTFADFAGTDIPTVEYSAYSSDALAITGGGSFEPEKVRHFVDRDPEQLAAVVRAAVERPPAVRRPAGERGDPGGVLAALARADGAGITS